MLEIAKIFLTATVAAIFGLLIFTLQRFLLDPISEQAKAIGRIGFALIFYAERYANPLDTKKADQPSISTVQRYIEAKEELRRCASELAATSNAIRCRRLFCVLGLSPSKEATTETIGLLIGISNALFDRHAVLGSAVSNSKAADAVRVLLKLNRVPVK